MHNNTILKSLDQNGFLRLPKSISKEKIYFVHKILNSLFSLPLHEKERYKSESSVSPGYTPYGGESAADTGIPNLLEAWEISTRTQAKWPPNMKKEWNTLVDFEKVLFQVGSQFLKTLAEEMELPSESFTALADSDQSVARYINYPAQLAQSNDTGATRQSLHADMSLITLNTYATSKGLLAETNGDLIEVNPAEDEIVIMPGSILEFITGGRIKACKHSVATPKANEKAQDRISMPFFVMPHDDQILSVFEKVAIEEKYTELEPVKAGEFIESFYHKVFSRNNPQ